MLSLKHVLKKTLIGFKAFLRKYSGDRNENRLRDNMISLYDELRSVPDYFKWARESAEWLRSDNVLSMTGSRCS